MEDGIFLKVIETLKRSYAYCMKSIFHVFIGGRYLSRAFLEEGIFGMFIELGYLWHVLSRDETIVLEAYTKALAALCRQSNRVRPHKSNRTSSAGGS